MFSKDGIEDERTAHYCSDYVVRNIAGLQCMPQRIQRQSVRRKALRIQFDMHDIIRSTNRVDITRAGHALDVCLDCVCNALQFVRAHCPRRIGRRSTRLRYSPSHLMLP